MVARGMATSRDLQLGAAAADPQDKSGKRTLDEIADRAIERANGTAAATTGTALHSFTEKIDRDEPLGYVPEEYLPDLEAYRRLMAEQSVGVLAIERFCVLDAYRIGGTYDRLLDLGGNIYFLAKVFSTDGRSFVQAVSTMTGMSVEDYQAMMVAGGRSPEGVRSKKDQG